MGVLSLSARIRTWTCEFMDKTPQIAEEQLVMTMDKALETKLQWYKSYHFTVFCWHHQKWRNFKLATDQQVYTLQFLCNKDIFRKSTHLQENKMLFRFRYSRRSKTHTFRFCPVTGRQIDKWTDSYNPPPMLGLITICLPGLVGFLGLRLLGFFPASGIAPPSIHCKSKLMLLHV